MKPAHLVFLFLLFPLAGKCQDDDSLLKPEDFNEVEPVHYVLTLDGNLALIQPNSHATIGISLGFQFLLDEHLAIGIGDAGFGVATLASGTRYGLGAGPIAQYTSPFANDWSYYFFGGFTVQVRWGANIGRLYGIMPYGGAGLEYYALPIWGNGFMTIGPFCKVEYVTSTKFLRMPRILPPSTVTIAGGIGFHFYF